MYPGSYPFKRFNPKSEIPNRENPQSEIESPAPRTPQSYRAPRIVRKILTTKSENIPLTSPLVPNKLNCY